MAKNEDRPDAADWERAMSAAARRFAQRLVDPRIEGRRELVATLLRLGFPLAETNAAVARSPGLKPVRLRAMREALQRELDLCARRARAARIDYDLNRHIAVFRALRQLDGAPEVSSSCGRRSRSPIASRSSAIAARVASSIRR